MSQSLLLALWALNHIKEIHSLTYIGLVASLALLHIYDVSDCTSHGSFYFNKVVEVVEVGGAQLQNICTAATPSHPTFLYLI